MDDIWYESKHELPPLGEVIEGIGSKDWLYSNLGRDYFALVSIKSELIWITPAFNEFDFKTLKITHWKPLAPNPKGKKPYVKIIFKKHFWIPKVFFE